jgi:ribosomal protein S18 acetylase RimI-like enzyme
MKRLYVRPQARGLRLGRLLTEALIAEAKQQGFTEMRLGVLSEFAATQKLYRELGLIAAEPVSFNPIPGTQFLGLTLS